MEMTERASTQKNDSEVTSRPDSAIEGNKDEVTEMDIEKQENPITENKDEGCCLSLKNLWASIKLLALFKALFSLVVFLYDIVSKFFYFNNHSNIKTISDYRG